MRTSNVDASNVVIAPDTALAGPQRLPRALGVVADRRDGADAGDRDALHSFVRPSPSAVEAPPSTVTKDPVM